MEERSLAQEWEAQAQAWARWTRTPGHDHHFHRYNWPAFLELLPSPGRATLDLGCGEGRAGVALRKLGHRLLGVDVSPSLARLARETGAYESVVVADAARLPFDDDSFDLVIAFMSLQDMDDAPGAVREAARVLVPGGRFVAAIVHPWSPVVEREYFETQRTVDTIERDGIAFTFHQMQRPLQAWAATLFDAGFVIEELREPRPTAADVAEHPMLARTRDRPAFLHVRGVAAPMA